MSSYPHEMSPVVPTGNVYGKYDATHPVERRLVRKFLGSLETVFPHQAPRVVIEVGIGEGEVAQLVQGRFPMARVMGVDLPDAALGRQWRTRGLAGLFGDAAHLPIADRSADLVLAVELLEHVPDPEGVLSEILRIASGTVVLSVPREPIWRLGNMARRRYLRALGNTPGHLQHWSKRSFVRFVEARADVQVVLTPFPWTLVVATPRSG